MKFYYLIFKIRTGSDKLSLIHMTVIVWSVAILIRQLHTEEGSGSGALTHPSTSAHCDSWF